MENHILESLQEQLPVIERALETAALMLGSGKSPGLLLGDKLRGLFGPSQPREWNQDPLASHLVRSAGRSHFHCYQIASFSSGRKSRAAFHTSQIPFGPSENSVSKFPQERNNVQRRITKLP